MRVVLDTSSVLSALLFPNGKLTWMRQLWVSGAIHPLATKQTTEEIIRVLAYPRFKLSPEEIELFLSDYIPYCQIVSVKTQGKVTPQCRDPNDQMFINLALQEKASYLVTSDKDLLVLASETLAGLVPFSILTPLQFKQIMDGKGTGKG